MLTLIFLHGFLGSKEDWEGVLPYLEYPCVAIDLPGHGSSPYSENILDTVRTAIAPYSRKVLIGYSLGGRIALQLMDNCDGVIALSAHLGLDSLQEREERLKTDQIWIEKLRSLPLETFLRQWYAQPLFDGTFPPRRHKQNPEALARVMEQMSLGKMEKISTFSKPTLFLYGKEDLKYEALYCKLPPSVLVRGIDGAHHAIHLQKPQLCATTLNAFLKEHLC
ncbi:MAG: alpha/beta fold hydrolase [Verrucomicrobia bacterium]|nr:alpha/beta fold hydrolase [Verrucomicrobiota bacterium]